MTPIATVEKILPGGMAEISVPRKSACGHDCEECAGCGVSGASVRAQARNTVGAEVGQKVVVEEQHEAASRRDDAWSICCPSCAFSSAALRPARLRARACAMPSPSRRFSSASFPQSSATGT